MEIYNQFQADMDLRSPLWVLIWVQIMALTVALSVPFSFIRSEARWVLGLGILGMIGTIVTYAYFDFTRILGIGHILFWTPLVLLLLARRKTWNIRGSWVGKWLVLVVIVLSVSLAFDYLDLARWLLGERDIIPAISS